MVHSRVECRRSFAEWTSLYIGMSLILLLIADLLKADEVCPKDSPPTTVALAVKEEGAPVIVSATINDHPYKLLIDTGSDKSHFDSSVKPDLGKYDQSGFGRVGGKLKWVSMYQAPRILVDDLPLTSDSVVACSDNRERFKRIDGIELDGILGMDYLRERVVQIDFDRFVLTIDASLADKQSLGEPIPLTMIEGRPYAELSINDNVVTMLVDLGGIGALSVRSKDFATIAKESAAALTSGGLYAERVAIGPHAHENMLVANSRISIIGLYYLNRFKITFDFKNHVMYLKPNSRFSFADHSGCDGAWFQLGQVKGKRAIGLRVIPGSLAEKRGVRFGDILLEFNGQSIDEMDPTILERNWCQRAGKEVAIRIRRNALDKDDSNDQELAVTLPATEAE